MVRYAVGYQSRAFVTFGAPITLSGYDPESRRDVMALAHLTRDTIGMLYKVLPTAVVAAALRPSITRRDLEDRCDAIIETVAAGGANMGVRIRPRGGRQRRPRRSMARNVIHIERGGRFRIRERTVLRYYARTIQHLMPGGRTVASHPLMIQTVSKAFFYDARRQLDPQEPRFALRHARAAQLRPPLHRRRNRRRGDRCRPHRRSHRACCRRSTCSARASRPWPKPMPRREPTWGCIDRIVAAGIGRNISLKLTQLGLTVDRATCVDNLRRILDAATTHGFFVRIDMENSPFTQVTLDVFETMWQQGYRNVGVVLQSCLPRSVARCAADERARRARADRQGGLQGTARRRLPGQGAGGRRVRRDHQDPAGRRHLPGHRHPRSGDDRRRADACAAEHGIAPDRFEFQMLYGIRRDLQAAALGRGLPDPRLRSLRP